MEDHPTATQRHSSSTRVSSDVRESRVTTRRRTRSTRSDHDPQVTGDGTSSGSSAPPRRRCLPKSSRWESRGPSRSRLAGGARRLQVASSRSSIGSQLSRGTFALPFRHTGERTRGDQLRSFPCTSSSDATAWPRAVARSRPSSERSPLTNSLSASSAPCAIRSVQRSTPPHTLFTSRRSCPVRDNGSPSTYDGFVALTRGHDEATGTSARSASRSESLCSTAESASGAWGSCLIQRTTNSREQLPSQRPDVHRDERFRPHWVTAFSHPPTPGLKAWRLDMLRSNPYRQLCCNLFGVGRPPVIRIAGTGVAAAAPSDRPGSPQRGLRRVRLWTQVFPIARTASRIVVKASPRLAYVVTIGG